MERSPSDRLDPEVARLLAARAAYDRPPEIPDLRSPVPAAPPGADAGPHDTVDTLDTVDTVVPLGDRTVGVRVYRGVREDVVTVWFHGGGFVKGDLDSQDRQARDVVRATGCSVVSVDYRLAPEHPFPAAHEDAVETVAWVARHGHRLTGASRPPRLALAGPSAGANLALGAALAVSGTEAEPVALLLAYPMLGGAPTLPSRRELADGPGLTTRAVDWLVEQYVPHRPDRVDPRFAVVESPLLHLAPPTVVTSAGIDPLRDDARELAVRLREAGVRVVQIEEPALPHGYWKYASDAGAARRAVDTMLAAFAQALLP